MAHHNFDPKDKMIFDDAPERSVEDAVNEAFGATGRYPEGKLSEDDEGELRFGVAVHKGKVILDFGKPVRSIGFTPEQAQQIAGSLLNKAKEAQSSLNTQ